MEEIPTRFLPVQLTKDEFIVKSKELSKKNKELETVEDEKKESAASFSARLKTINGEIKHLAQVVATNTEYRNVEVRKEMNFERGIVQFYRRDTGEFVESRSMTYEERQKELFEPAALNA